MKYLVAACICFALSLLIISYAVADVGDGFNGEVFSPVIEYKTSYTPANKAWLAGAIVGQAADLASTAIAVSNGGEEANPVYGSHPNYLIMALVKASLLGGSWLIVEYLVNPAERKVVRNWAYGSLAVIGGGAAFWNMGQVMR